MIDHVNKYSYHISLLSRINDIKQWVIDNNLQNDVAVTDDHMILINGEKDCIVHFEFNTDEALMAYILTWE